ncbi:OmpH family outer membrane protein [Dyella psychrodurans]|uniref:OmpH family outer membrane protein n=1 Tax=Dyella psychrodurans TaxID=1927960 RepID=A0A370XCI9_9GAMM|nr:OmpH family outer membrane protein [Dyella psychrodurans]RDS85941.1 OmpH family outer membrane protein [Dyella psychrodurans]
MWNPIALIQTGLRKRADREEYVHRAMLRDSQESDSGWEHHRRSRQEILAEYNAQEKANSERRANHADHTRGSGHDRQEGSRWASANYHHAWHSDDALRVREERAKQLNEQREAWLAELSARQTIVQAYKERTATMSPEALDAERAQRQAERNRAEAREYQQKWQQSAAYADAMRQIQTDNERAQTVRSERAAAQAKQDQERAAIMQRAFHGTPEHPTTPAEGRTNLDRGSDKPAEQWVDGAATAWVAAHDAKGNDLDSRYKSSNAATFGDWARQQTFADRPWLDAYQNEHPFPMAKQADAESHKPPADAAQKSTAADRMTGTLVDHGPAPYKNDPQNNESYFVTVQPDAGKQATHWGKDLSRAMAESQVQIGDRIHLERTGQDTPVAVKEQVRDDQGHVVATQDTTAVRKGWSVTNLSAPIQHQEPTPDAAAPSAHVEPMEHTGAQAPTPTRASHPESAARIERGMDDAYALLDAHAAHQGAAQERVEPPADVPTARPPVDQDPSLVFDEPAVHEGLTEADIDALTITDEDVDWEGSTSHASDRDQNDVAVAPVIADNLRAKRDEDGGTAGQGGTTQGTNDVSDANPTAMTQDQDTKAAYQKADAHHDAQTEATAASSEVAPVGADRIKQHRADQATDSGADTAKPQKTSVLAGESRAYTISKPEKAPPPTQSPPSEGAPTARRTRTR